MALNKIIKNYIYNMSYQALMIILPIITIPYLTRVLGANNLGIERYVESVATMYTVFGMLGLSLYSNRTIAYERDDRTKLSKCFFELLYMRIGLLIATILVYVVFTCSSEYGHMYQIFIIYLIGTFLDVTWLFTGVEDMKPVVIRNFIVRILSTVSLFMFVKKPEDVYIYGFIIGITILVNSIAMYPFCRKYISRIPFSELNMRRHIMPALALFLPQAATQIYAQCDKVMIKKLVNDVSWVSFYSENEKVAKMPIILASSLSTVLMPRLANEFAVGNKDAIKNYVQKAFTALIMILIPCCIGLICVAQNFIPLFLGKEFADSYGLTMILSPIVIFIGLSSVTGTQFLISVNNVKALTISYVTAAVINVIINFMLIPKHNAYGAAIGTVIAELTVLIIQYIYMRKAIGGLGCVKIALQVTIASLIMGIAVYTLRNISGSILITLTIQIGAGCLIYGLLLLVIWKIRQRTNL